jgi:hypothetical protein
MLLIVGVLVLVYWLFTDSRGVAVATPEGFSYPGYSISKQKPYKMEARVLGRKNYSFGREADLSPVDLALGWGPMMNPTTLQDIEISQSGRFYFWHVDQFPIPRKAIEHNSANVHIVPANPQVAEALAEIDTDDTVTLNGQLINVAADDGWRWRTSLSFTDTGKGSCELLWLEALTIL